MSQGRLADYLDHLQLAATHACGFVEGLSKSEFLQDKRTQQAVILNLIIIGEAATKAMDFYSEFTLSHPEMPWRQMRGMRNRMAHGYFDVDLEVVWETVQTALPELLKQLPAVRLDLQQCAAALSPPHLPRHPHHVAAHHQRRFVGRHAGALQSG